ncbi:dipeptide ABC transporter ATP-binding protein [Plantactinospora mayteni]|uniref:ABC transporter ATP-binding protein n=1 Tax=Plantactinospora mayteni TaxID=566021 RepID=A0ABQ4ER80_9ACTN|nr:ABC transporter ATP-binding protein [Plantactinospora mayteni]GIG97180.1 ABC transporter ATP-binding protein [Plantactinospora mayteni]
MTQAVSEPTGPGAGSVGPQPTSAGSAPPSAGPGAGSAAWRPGSSARRADRPLPILRVQDLVVRHRTGTGTEITAVDGVSLEVRAGETLGLVGESGCGKSSLANAVLRLIPTAGGSIVFDGEELVGRSSAELRRIRRHLQVVFQDPRGSLDPRMRLGDIVTEALKVHGMNSRRERRSIAAERLTEVGLDPSLAHRRPAQLSGGQQQRVAVARALVTQPRLVVLDEPVSALDVSVQAQVINLLQDMQQAHAVAYLFIAHNLAVVRHLSHRVAVMYLGKIVEQAPAHNLFARPAHPYTKALVASVLPPRPDVRQRLEAARRLAPGEVPSLTAVPPGCRYHTRCPFADVRCRNEEPVLSRIAGDHAGGHRVACHHWERAQAAMPQVRAH